MYCSKCGIQNPDDASFCSKCGNNLKFTEAKVIPKAEPVILQKTNENPIKPNIQNEQTVQTKSVDVSQDTTPVVMLWQISKESVMNLRIDLDTVRDFLIAELGKTDIKTLIESPDCLRLVRGEPTSDAMTAEFSGELKLSEVASKIGIQLVGTKDFSKVRKGLWTACCGCGLPGLLAWGTGSLIQQKYIEKTLDAIIKKMCATLGTHTL